jgi:hypothetical protein
MHHDYHLSTRNGHIKSKKRIFSFEMFIIQREMIKVQPLNFLTGRVARAAWQVVGFDHRSPKDLLIRP